METIHPLDGHIQKIVGGRNEKGCAHSVKMFVRKRFKQMILLGSSLISIGGIEDLSSWMLNFSAGGRIISPITIVFLAED